MLAEDVLRYCVGIYRRLAVRYGTKKAEELVHSQSLDALEENGMPAKVSDGQNWDPFVHFLKKEQSELIRRVIHMYMSCLLYTSRCV